MATKFSDFNSETTLSNITGLVGYISSSNTNVRISPTDLITGTTNTLAEVLAAGSVASNTNAVLIDTANGNDLRLQASGSGAVEVTADKHCNIQGAFDDPTGSLNLIVGQSGADFNVLITGTTPTVGDVLEVSSVNGQTGTLQWATPNPEITVISLPDTPDQDIYNDGNIYVKLNDASTDDIQVQVLTNAAGGNSLTFTWESSYGTPNNGGNSLNVLSGITTLNGNFGNYQIMRMQVYAPTDATYPYYEFVFTKGAAATNFITRVSKYTY